MKTKSIIYLSFLIIGLVLSLGVVCASENMTETHSLSAFETPSDEIPIENNEPLLSTEPDLEESDVLSVPEPCHPKVPEPCHPSVPGNEIVPTNSFNSSIIVDKHWEGGYSGNITSIEIQLLHKNEVYGPHCPPKWKSSPNDPIFNETIGTVVVLPDGKGNMVSYTIVQTATISKENNWRHVFRNLTFNSASLVQTPSGDRLWYLGDSHEYIIREINIQQNVEFISAIFVKNFTCPVDGGLKVFWNLTNRIKNETNETEIKNETNETTVITNQTNETELFNDTPLYDDYGKGPDSPSEDSSKTPEESVEKKVDKNVDISKATGNPLLILLIVLSILIAPVLRKKD